MAGRRGEMPLPFAPGDDLVFQLESGFGLLRVLGVEERGGETIWHLMAYEDFYPDVESAEAALGRAGEALIVRNPHLALTSYALEKTPVAQLGNRPLTQGETQLVRNKIEQGVDPSNVSVLLTLGLR
ncbi:MAG: hypothetical protein H0V27_01500 [Pyrinomonadaceae bacterium]|nr:hypothetical protein [Pyrinomonadaceae bacterium]